MCGIAGMFGDCFRGNIDPKILEMMVKSLIHRGPDEEGIFISQEEGVGLGHRRLSIIDLKTGQQPMASIDGNLQIVFNGEIYNFKELKKELQDKGYHFRTHCDTEVIIYMYAEYGEKGFERLNGIFAFAIFDKKKHSLIIARGHFGVKPLYYALVNGGIIFASEIKAILCHPSFKRVLDYEALNSFFTFRYNPSPQTLFKGIHKLAPGHYMRIYLDHRSLETGSYWPYKPVTNLKISEADAVMEYKRLLKNAVERQMLSDVPVGLFLSGGIDSAVIGYLMKNYDNNKIKTFTIGFKDRGDFNELFEARQTAELLESDHYELELSEKEYVDFFFKSFYYSEEPIAETTIPALYYVAKLASKHVKVVLAGQGADEPMAGYDRYLGMKYISQYAFFLQKLPLWEISKILPRNEKIKRAAYVNEFYTEQQRFLAAYTIFTPRQKDKLFNSSTQRKIINVDAKLVECLYNQCPGLQDTLSKIMFIDTRMSLPDNLLLFNDKMTMANSIEMRVPFLDIELIKFLETLPSSLKLRGKTGKYIHKKAIVDWLPSKIINRKKRGFETPMDKWLQGDLALFTKKIINENNSVCSQYFNISAINEMINLHQTRKENFYRQIFCLLSFEIWHRSFFENQKIDYSHQIKTHVQTRQLIREDAFESYYKIFNKLDKFVIKEQFAGYDPYDGLNSRMFSSSLFYKIPLLRLVWIQFFKRSPINFRNLALVSKGFNPKGGALILLGKLRYFIDSETPKQIEHCHQLFNLLENCVIKTKYGFAWGYNFSWQSKAFYVPLGTPNIITSLYVAKALMEYNKKFKSLRALELVEGVRDFILKEMILREDDKVLTFRYVPEENAIIHNANLTAAAFLGNFYKEDTRIKSIVMKTVQSAVIDIQENGYWPYGLRSHHRWMDNFHTGFCLEALLDIRKNLQVTDFDNQIQKVFRYYSKNFFEDNGLPKYYANNTYPVDIHNISESLILCSRIEREDSGLFTCEDRDIAQEIRKKVWNYAVENFWNEKEGYFYFQKTRLFTNKISYIRWSQAWMYYAISECLNDPGER